MSLLSLVNSLKNKLEEKNYIDIDIQNILEQMEMEISISSSINSKQIQKNIDMYNNELFSYNTGHWALLKGHGWNDIHFSYTTYLPKNIYKNYMDIPTFENVEKIDLYINETKVIQFYEDEIHYGPTGGLSEYSIVIYFKDDLEYIKGPIRYRYMFGYLHPNLKDDYNLNCSTYIKVGTEYMINDIKNNIFILKNLK
jgi:hypothetical protein